MQDRKCGCYVLSDFYFAGDFIVTSKKKGHGKAVKRGYLLKKDLFGKVIAQALESGDADSYTIKCMIRKM